MIGVQSAILGNQTDHRKPEGTVGKPATEDRPVLPGIRQVQSESSLHLAQ